jgi:hypothetical protein
MNIVTARFSWMDNCPYDCSYDWSCWAADAWYLEAWAPKVLRKITDGR